MQIFQARLTRTIDALKLIIRDGDSSGAAEVHPDDAILACIGGHPLGRPSVLVRQNAIVNPAEPFPFPSAS